MVSIHKVPVIIHLIIRVTSSTFRFKRGIVLLSVPRVEALALPIIVELITSEPTLI